MRYITPITFLFVFLSFSCKDDTEITPTEPEVVLTDNVLVYDSEKIHDHLSLLVKSGSTTSLLVDKQGNTLHEWNFETNLGNDFELLPDGKSIGMFK